MGKTKTKGGKNETKKEESKDQTTNKGDSDANSTQNIEQVQTTTPILTVDQNIVMALFKVSNASTIEELSYKLFSSNYNKTYVNAYLNIIKTNNKSAPELINPVTETTSSPTNETDESTVSKVKNMVLNMINFKNEPSYYYLAVFTYNNEGWNYSDTNHVFPIFKNTYDNVSLKGFQKIQNINMSKLNEISNSQKKQESVSVNGKDSGEEVDNKSNGAEILNLLTDVLEPPELTRQVKTNGGKKIKKVNTLKRKSFQTRQRITRKKL